MWEGWMDGDASTFEFRILIFLTSFKVIGSVAEH